jgi:hypothetical protein
VGEHLTQQGRNLVLKELKRAFYLSASILLIACSFVE